MLILTRKLGEGIRINEDIVVKVVDIRGNQVRLGIAAPRSVPVHREEVHEMIAQQNEMAAKSAPENLESVAVLWKQGQKSE
jgi:carbon storage regulator